MKRLMLLRHAKSDWASGANSDHQRPLNARGRKNAPRMGAYMAGAGYIPDLILSSDSTRTRETVAGILTQLPADTKVTFSPDLYHASESTLLSAAAKAPDSCETLLLVAHNPGMHALAAQLMQLDADRTTAPFLYGNFPTAGLAIFTFDTDSWSHVAFHSGTLECYQTPKTVKHHTKEAS